jgi:hypothetical protein
MGAMDCRSVCQKYCNSAAVLTGEGQSGRMRTVESTSYLDISQLLRDWGDQELRTLLEQALTVTGRAGMTL